MIKEELKGFISCILLEKLLKLTFRDLLKKGLFLHVKSFIPSPPFIWIYYFVLFLFIFSLTICFYLEHWDLSDSVALFISTLDPVRLDGG